MWRTALGIVGGLAAWAVIATLLNFGLRAANSGLSCRRGDAAVHDGDESGSIDRGCPGLNRRRDGHSRHRASEPMGAADRRRLVAGNVSARPRPAVEQVSRLVSPDVPAQHRSVVRGRRGAASESRDGRRGQDALTWRISDEPTRSEHASQARHRAFHPAGRRTPHTRHRDCGRCR